MDDTNLTGLLELRGSSGFEAYPASGMGLFWSQFAKIPLVGVIQRPRIYMGGHYKVTWQKVWTKATVKNLDHQWNCHPPNYPDY